MMRFAGKRFLFVVVAFGSMTWVIIHLNREENKPHAHQDVDANFSWRERLAITMATKIYRHPSPTPAHNNVDQQPKALADRTLPAQVLSAPKLYISRSGRHNLSLMSRDDPYLLDSVDNSKILSEPPSPLTLPTKSVRISRDPDEPDVHPFKEHHDANFLGRESDNNTYEVVIFTTFTDEVERRLMHTCVIENWIQLSTTVKTVLFDRNPNSFLAMLARSRGWDVWPIPRVSVSGTPYVADMYEFIYRKYLSVFYGFVNGDILFPPEVLTTLQAVYNGFQVKQERSILVVGLRNDFTLSNTTDLNKLSNPMFVKQELRGRVLHEARLDYFFTERTGFPWKKLEDFIVGRVSMDNYFMASAVSLSADTVDATATLPVLHLQGPDGTMTSRFATHSDDTHNRRRMLKSDYTISLSANARFETYISGDSILIRPRSYQKTVELMPRRMLNKFLQRHSPSTG